MKEKNENSWIQISLKIGGGKIDEKSDDKFAKSTPRSAQRIKICLVSGFNVMPERKKEES